MTPHDPQDDTKTRQDKMRQGHDKTRQEKRREEKTKRRQRQGQRQSQDKDRQRHDKAKARQRQDIDDKEKATQNPQDNRTRTTRSRRIDEGGDEPQSPPYHHRPQVRSVQSGAPPHQDLPRRGLFSHHFSLPFLTQLKSQKASQDDPFWRPKSA